MNYKTFIIIVLEVLFIFLPFNLLAQNKSNFINYDINVEFYKNENEEFFIFINYLNATVDVLDSNYFEIKKVIDSYDSTIFVIKIKKYGNSNIIFNVRDLNIVIKYSLNFKLLDSININKEVNLGPISENSQYFKNYFTNRIFYFFNNNIFLSLKDSEINNLNTSLDIENLNISYLFYLGIYYYLTGNFSLSSSYFTLLKDYFNNFKDKIYSYKKLEKDFKKIEKNISYEQSIKLQNIQYFEGKIFFYSSYMLAKIHILAQNEFVSLSNFEEALNFIYNNNFDEEDLDKFLIIILRVYFIKNEFQKIVEFSKDYLNVISNSRFKNYFFYILGYSYFYKNPPDFKNSYYFLKQIDKNFVNYNIVLGLINVIEKNKLNK
ncbi:MAG: hypothetical protein N3A58_06915 [Spirochaetes bacterium]|nr:hypothetical protein [Spirochaetota bacterium]